VTLSSIYTNPPGTTAMPGGIHAPDAKQESPKSSAAVESLQEVTDHAKFSTLAPRIRAALDEISGSENNVLDTLSGNVQKLQDGFIETLYTTLTRENVDLSQKMTLKLGSDSILTVAGEHPEKERVNLVLAENPALSTAFSEIASQSEVLRDIANISKVVTRHTGVDAYAIATNGKPSSAVYQMSLKGDMSHFYFLRP